MLTNFSCVQPGCWKPYQGSAGANVAEFAGFSDHFFLLRKGVPVRRLSFNADVQHAASQPGRSTEVGRGYDAGIPAVFKTKVTCKIRYYVVQRNTRSSGKYVMPQRRLEQKSRKAEGARMSTRSNHPRPRLAGKVL